MQDKETEFLNLTRRLMDGEGNVNYELWQWVERYVKESNEQAVRRLSPGKLVD